MKGRKPDFFVYFSQFPCSCIRIRIPNPDPDPGHPNQCRSMRIRIHNIGWRSLLFYFNYLFHAFLTTAGRGRHMTSCCSMAHRWADELPTGTRHKINTLYFMDLKAIKTSNLKCRLYWYLIQFIDSHSASCLYMSICKKSRQLVFVVFIVIWSMLYLILHVNLHPVVLQIVQNGPVYRLNISFNHCVISWNRARYVCCRRSWLHLHPPTLLFC